MSFFGGKDPFDDPFFTRPFGGLFGGKDLFDSPLFPLPYDRYDRKAGSELQVKEVAIEELKSEDDTQKHSMSSEQPIITFPNENASVGKHNFSFRRVAYGGLNGMYYTSSMARATSGDGVTMLEMKEEDKAMGQALHTVSRGIQDKGHSVTTKHKSDGKVDTLQTLHNLNEDEIAGFDENWKSNVQRYLPGWNDGFSLLENAEGSQIGWNGQSIWDGWALPFAECSEDGEGLKQDTEDRTLSSRGRPKKVVPVNIE